MARKPDPTYLKAVKGVRRKDRLNPAEPKTAPGWPDRPAALTRPAARAAWARFGKLLLDMGALSPADGPALQRLAETFADVCDLQARLASYDAPTYLAGAKLDEAGQPILGTGMMRAWPEAALLSDADRRLRSLMAEFGLTPASRTRIKVTDPTDAADADRAAGWA
jgi:P27 family predicted phage terminase small subunit